MNFRNLHTRIVDTMTIMYMTLLALVIIIVLNNLYVYVATVLIHVW